MAQVQTLLGDTVQTGNLTIQGGYLTAEMAPTKENAVNRTNITPQTSRPFSLDPMTWRVHDAPATLLPGTSASDDLGIYGNLSTPAAIVVSTGDVKTTSGTRYAAGRFVLPQEYKSGGAITFRFVAGMETTVASSSCSIDVEVFAGDGSGGLGSDICTTGATTINSLTYATVDFTVTPTNRVAGDILYYRVAIAWNDSATVTAVTPTIDKAQVLLTIEM